ncbi:hypothetical protein CHUAL_001386 [Chamberlinius hualienensis]
MFDRVQPEKMNFCQTALSKFFEYNTPQVVHIRSKKIGLLSRLVQLCIISYVIGFVIIYKKGYQEFSEISSSVTTKLKGVAFPNYTNEIYNSHGVSYPDVYRKVWDVADYVVVPMENNAFFVMTNAIITPNQQQSICPEDPQHPKAWCSPPNNTCKAGKAVVYGNGIMTGRCIPAADHSRHVCEIQGWCPVELNIMPLRNIPDRADLQYLETCQFSSLADPLCPIFRLGTIVREAGEDYEKIAIKGAVLNIIITWECNLDFDPDKYCKPSYSFRRLDDPNAKISNGWNFSYYGDNNRTLYKAFGIRFMIEVRGRGGKFNIVPLLLNVGSGLALLGLSTIICDIIILYICKKKRYYYEKKFILV